MLVAVILLVKSCKKQQDTQQEQIDPKQQKEIHSYQNGNEVKTINLNEFRAKVDLKTLGTLQQAFEKPKFSKEGTMLLNTEQTYEGFALQTDSIKMLTANWHTSYIFPVKLSSPRAVTFQNLTIDQSPEGTKIFVNTYTPTQQWIADWRAGKAGKFEGEISVSYLNGDNNPSYLKGSNNNISANGKIASANTPNKIMLEQEACSTTTYYFALPYNCGSGQHGPGDTGCYLTGDDRAGIAYISFDITTCTTTGGGGGGTSPTPPGDYDPCGSGGNLPTVSYNGAIGAKLIVHENPDCNPTVPPVLPEPVQLQREIRDAALKPCMKAVLNDLKDLNNSISTLIRAFTGSGPNYDWTLANGSTTNGTLANTSRWDRVNNNVTTTIDGSQFYNASNIGIAKTLLHEAIHAYLVAYFANDPQNAYKEYPTLVEEYSKQKRPDLNEAHHNEMVRIFVSQISDALKTYGDSKGITFSSNLEKEMFYGDIAWAGLYGNKSL